MGWTLNLAGRATASHIYSLYVHNVFIASNLNSATLCGINTTMEY